LNCSDGRQGVCTFILRHHRDNGYTRNVATTATAATLVAGRGKRLQKRRRAPPGGRAAPARTVRPWGGRPVPSLSVAYPQSALVCDHQCRFSCYWRRIRYRYPSQRQPNRITTYAEGSEKGLSLTLLTPGRSFHLVRLSDAGQASGIGHGPLTADIYHVGRSV
jgi:hypothetical protein